MEIETFTHRIFDFVSFHFNRIFFFWYFFKEDDEKRFSKAKGTALNLYFTPFFMNIMF